MTQQDGVVRKWWVQRIGHYVGAKGNYIAPNGFEEPCLSNEMMCAEHNRLVSLVQAQSEALEWIAGLSEVMRDQSESPLTSNIHNGFAEIANRARAALSAIRAQLKEE